jgi:hypothetical protein
MLWIDGMVMVVMIASVWLCKVDHASGQAQIAVGVPQGRHHADVYCWGLDSSKNRSCTGRLSTSSDGQLIIPLAATFCSTHRV